MSVVTLILGFLKAYWLPVTVITATGILYWKISNAWEDYTEWRALQAQTVTELTVVRDRAIVEATAAKAVIKEMEVNAKRLELLLEDALARQDEIRAEAKAQKEVFEEHNFKELTEAKPGLIERLANKATQERMDAFEDIINN